MIERRSNFVDRRSGTDRRKVYKLGYFLNGGVERRNGKERRSKVERRTGWVQMDDFSSAFVREETSF